MESARETREEERIPLLSLAFFKARKRRRSKRVKFSSFFFIFRFFFKTKTSPLVAVSDARASLFCACLQQKMNPMGGGPGVPGGGGPGGYDYQQQQPVMMPMMHQQQNLQGFAGAAAPPGFAGGLLPQAGQGRPGRAFDRHDPAFYKTRMCTQVSKS